MIALNRYALLALAAAFSIYNVIRGVITLPQAESPWPSIVGMVLYLVVTIISLWPSSPTAMPLWLASLNLGTAVALPLLVTSQLDPSVNNGYATWHVASIGALMTITAVRRREAFAWIGIIFLTAQSILWAGAGVALQIGIPGSILWVALASILTRSLVRVGRDEQNLAIAEREAAQWQAAQDAHHEERRVRLKQAERVALPTLRNIILAGGSLSQQERAEAKVLEAGLRDEIRGRMLLNDAVRARVAEARRRGSVISMLDEGTLDEIAEEDRQRVLDRVADAVASTSAHRMIVRTAPVDSPTAVTVVALNPSGDPDDDEDEVQLWLEIPRKATADWHTGA